MAKCAKGIQNAPVCERPKANALPCPRGKARGTGDTTTLHTLPTEAPSWWASTSATYLSKFRLTVHHIPGIKNELSDYISRNNFDALIGESSDALAKEAVRRMDVQPDLSMRTAGILEGWSLTDYQSEYKERLQTLSTGLEPRVIDGHQWYQNNQYLFYEDRIVVPEARLDGCLQWSHLSSGHTCANRSVDFFR